VRYLALELDDRAVSLAAEGRVLSSAPSAVFDGTSGGPMGVNAWGEVRLRPRAISTRHLGAVLTQRATSARSEALLEAELKVRLAQQPVADDERVWIVAPAQAEAVGLTALLGVTRRVSLHVEGFVDSAAITAAALGAEQTAIVLELGLHHAAATAVDCEGAQARRRRSLQTERGGLIELYQVWLALVSTTMVKRTRFDPLHDAVTEQQVFEAIPDLAVEAARTGSVTASVTKGVDRFEAVLTRDQFSQVAQPIYRSIVALVHQLRPAGVPVTIVVPQLAVQLPGLREQLEQFVGCELVSVPDGFAAVSTSLLELPEPQGVGAAVRLLRRLPLAAQMLPVNGEAPEEPAVVAESHGGARDSHGMDRQVHGVTREWLGQRRTGGPAPSHVLWDGRAYSLSSESLVVGCGPSDSSRHITLPDGLAGVSRRHCTFVHDADELVLLDHSTFGTFVNGERVQERVRIHAGDRVQLGEPGVELALIAVGEVAAATQQS
jgi:FHA domain